MGQTTGLGSPNYNIAIYIANRPQIETYLQLTKMHALIAGEIAYIGMHTSNHWRKVFNVMAKFIFELKMATDRIGNKLEANTWQEYRDHTLLQSHSDEALLFSPPEFKQSNRDSIHIITGKHYANTLQLVTPVTWLDNYFAINRQNKLIVCPYFDYRQLSNIRITALVNLVIELLASD